MSKEQPRILIVEDEAVVADDLKSRLEREYTITGVASSGKDAIRMAQSDPPDVIVMDVRLKGEMTGVQTAILIQTECRKPVPVVFLSELSAEETSMLPAVERYTYIQKPVSDDNLFQAIEKVLRQGWYTIEEPAEEPA